jgi:hypothetical protein
MARAVVDQPLSMTVQVRGFDWPASRLTPDCLQIQIQQGESGEMIAPVRVRTLPSGEDGRVVVQISSPQTVTDTVLTGRLGLLCGADYTREFTVLVDPPTTSATTKRSAQQPVTVPAVKPAAAGVPVRPVEMGTASRSVTRSDDPPPATAASVRTLEDAEVQRLVNAVVAALAPTPSNGPPAPPSTHPGSVNAEPPLQDLRDEQRQTRASLAALAARIEHNERNVWRDAVLVVGGVLGLAASLLVLRVMQEGLMPSMGSTEPAVAHRLRRKRAQSRQDNDPFAARTPVETPPVPTPARSDAGLVDWSPPPPPTQNVQRAWEPDGTPTMRWPGADFGHPSLDTTSASTELLHELEPHVAESPIGVAVVLERRLQELPGKCPWILLRLLELYRQMAQPWNHERVAAQLEALYNVRIPAMEMGTASAFSGVNLEAYPDTLDKIRQAWPLDDSVALLAAVLLRPTVIEVLDQPAFEDALLLHGIARQRQSVWLTAVEAGASSPGSAQPPPDRNRLMDLLAA